MKINELISNFEIFTTNEEKELLEKISEPVWYNSFNERDQFILQSLIRKSLITRINVKNNTYVCRNNPEV